MTLKIDNKKEKIEPLAKVTKKLGFTVFAFYDGLVNIKSFIGPLIIFHLPKKPKFQYKREEMLTKKFLKENKLKSIKGISKEKIDAYYRFNNLLQKNGETREFKSWGEKNKQVFKEKIYTKYLEYLNRYELIHKKHPIGFTYFTDGNFRLDFYPRIGDYKKQDKDFDALKKLNLAKKRQIQKEMIAEMLRFAEFLEKGLKTLFL